MEPWLELATRLFPDQLNFELKFHLEAWETVWQLIFDLKHEVMAAHTANDIELLEKIYGYAEWCYELREAEPDYWQAAFCGFYEHLGDKATTYGAIPYWVKPAIFKEMLGELEDRLDNKAKYPFERPGSFTQLLENYDAVHGTNFAAEHRRRKA